MFLVKNHSSVRKVVMTTHIDCLLSFKLTGFKTHVRDPRTEKVRLFQYRWQGKTLYRSDFNHALFCVWRSVNDVSKEIYQMHISNWSNRQGKWQNIFMNTFVWSCLCYDIFKTITGILNISFQSEVTSMLDGCCWHRCWRPNVLVTTLRCWWPI